MAKITSIKGAWIFPFLLVFWTGIILGQDKLTSSNAKSCFLIHGLTADATYLIYLENKLLEYKACSSVYRTEAYPFMAGFAPLQQQIDGAMGEDFRRYSDSHLEGFHLIGHSQGATLARALVEDYIDHHVLTIICIAGTMAGQYGLLLYTELTEPMIEQPLMLEMMSARMYTKSAQESSSAANVWNDPFQQEKHLKYNTFLPYYDNLIITNKSESYKKAFIKVDKLVTITGEDDTLIRPWQTGEFSYYDSSGKVVKYDQRDVYINDLFGLQTLDKAGKWIRCNQAGVNHFLWTFNDSVIQRCMVPYLG